MANNPNILNAAPMKRVPSRSPHPPKTDKFSKVDQLRKNAPTIENPAIIPGKKLSAIFAGDTGAACAAVIDPATKQLKIGGIIPNITPDSITKIFTASEESDSVPDSATIFNQTVNPQPDTSAEKSASDTSPYKEG